ncbi:MAG TPA: hypothetical protein VLJ21_04040 [Candidatus Binatia bacterium]|nr:hypothetical protein [Candidatus Binatia bacterium]
MAVWKKVLLTASTLVLTFALGFSVLSLAFSKLTSEETLRPFVQNLAAQQGLTPSEFEAQFDKIYHAKYACGGVLGCVNDPPKEGLGAVLISETGHQFFAQSAGYAVVIALLAAIGVLMTAETWSGRLRGIGLPLFVAGLNIGLQPIVEAAAFKGAPQETLAYVQPLLDTVFTTFTFYYAIMLIAGILITIAGFILLKRERKMTPAPGAS